MIMISIQNLIWKIIPPPHYLFSGSASVRDLILKQEICCVLLEKKSETLPDHNHFFDTL